MFESSSENYERATKVVDSSQEVGTLEGSEIGSISQTSPGQQKVSNWLSSLVDFRVDFGPSKKDILNFTNQLAVMVRAGISLQDSLESIAEQQESQKFSAIITDLKNQIEEGKSFSQALAEHDQVFSNL
ncbi:MAG: hypothetical protein AMJ43_09625, partial [Coxiella sp. DG_40]